MSQNFESVHSISRLAGADYSQPGVGENRFAVVNPNPVTSYTNPDNPGRWYGSSGDPPPIPAGNVLVNTVAGADCQFVIVGKALAGEAIECAFEGRVLVVVGAGGVTAGLAVRSDHTGAAVGESGSGHILGQALSTAVEGELVDIIFQPRGEA